MADQRASKDAKRKNAMSASSSRPSIWYGLTGRFRLALVERFRVPVSSREIVG